MLPNNGGFVARPLEVPVAVAKPKTVVAKSCDCKQKELRQRLCKTVSSQALTKRLNFNEIWAIVYRRLLDATGFNVVSRGIASGKKYIDCRQEFGYLQEALSIAAAL